MRTTISDFPTKKAPNANLREKQSFSSETRATRKGGLIRPTPSPVGLIIKKVEGQETERAKVRQRKRKREAYALGGEWPMVISEILKCLILKVWPRRRQRS